jgi:leucyl-tRNA synthetase
MNNNNYDYKKVESKWKKIWEENGVNQTPLKTAKKPYYNLMMYPYPSAAGLHVGNLYAFTGSDVHGRYKRMKGYDVFEPIGFDSGGIHSENYAIKIGKHPKKVIAENIEHYIKQLKMTGIMYDWDHTVDAMDPDYYRWTQWIFIQLFKAGLAYKKSAAVNFCPSCKTVLADEQVINGECERCDSQVTKKELSQWFFKITDYADRLLENTHKLNWSEKVLVAQRNWIGKSEGLIEKWQVDGMDLELESFTTWPHTTFGATFMVIAPEHPIIETLVKGTEHEEGVKAFIKEVEQDKIKDKDLADKEKKGYFLGRYVINHLTDKKMPIYIANFAVMDYGTGIVKCTPTHDQRDFEFAKKYNLPMVLVVTPKDKKLNPNEMKEAYTGSGIMTENTAEFEGMSDIEARKAVAEYSVKMGHAKKTTNYHLRDWLISRQRYWGPPIPMIYCENCAKEGKGYKQNGNGIVPGWYPVPEKDLPVLLPETDDFLPDGSGKAPLSRLESFVNCQCPSCGANAKRETDVSDTFLDSSWYFLRYPNVVQVKHSKSDQPAGGLNKNEQLPWDDKIMKKWLPVNQYCGGAEHSVLHLMYSRFITMALHDLGYIDFEEPFPNFYAHGLIIKDGAKMSKSKGNVVNPDEYIDRYGADVFRMYLSFIGPYSDGGDFRDSGIAGMERFVKRVIRLIDDKQSKGIKSDKDKKELESRINIMIKRVTEGIERFKYNTAIASMMEFINYLDKIEIDEGDNGGDSSDLKLAIDTLVLLMAPFTPYFSEEIWQEMKNSDSEFISVHDESWPIFDEGKIVFDKVIIVVQINGKVRVKVEVEGARKEDKNYVINEVMRNEKVKKYIEGRTIKKEIFIPGRLVSLVF